MISILRDEHTPDLTARGLMRRHLRGGVILDVPIADPEEHPDALAWAAERERRDRAYVSTSSTGTGIAVRCVCWHRTAGDHTANCPAADTGDLLPPWREATETHREYRGTDATGRRMFAEVRTKVLRAPVEVSDEHSEHSKTTPSPSIAAETAAAPERPSAPEMVCVLDTETTGLKRGHDGARVTEIAVAVVNLQTGEILRRAASLLSIDVPVPADITRLTGITSEMLRGKPALIDLWPKVVKFVGDFPVVAHNAAFDRGMIEDALGRASVLSSEWPRWRWYDSKTLAQRVMPGLPSYSLSGRPGQGPGLRETLKLPRQTAHRALGDVLTTCALLVELRKRAGKPWSEWCGDAHVWGVGIERAQKPQAAARPSDPQTASKHAPRTVKARAPKSPSPTLDLFSHLLLKPAGVTA